MSTEDRDAELDRLVRAAVRRPLPPVALGGTVDARYLDTQLAHAEALAVVDELPDQRRLDGLKRLVMRVARLFLHRQTAFNRQSVEIARLLNQQVASHVAAVDQRMSALAAAQVDLELRIEEHLDSTERRSLEFSTRLEHEVLALRRHVDAAVAGLDARPERAEDEKRVMADLEKRLARVDAAIAALTSVATTASRARSTSEHPALRHDALPVSVERLRAARYASFEDRFRGSQDDVRAMLSPYLQDVLARPESAGDALDIGCARGEWLRLLGEHGISARGVDLNSETVAESVKAGLDVTEGDGLDHLAGLAEASLGVLSAFHVLEHLPVEDHDRFFEAAARALRPGGLLIVETPNPTNLVVGASAFYRDPSHVRPIHPDYLAFLASACGFVDVEIRFLHPRSEYEQLELQAEDQLTREVQWAIYGPQDLALVARRPEHL